MSDSIQYAIDETLSLGRMSRSAPDSSFVVNEASKELRRFGARALPVIERTIRDRVVPAFVSGSDKSLAALGGLLSLWVSYFSIVAEESDARRAVNFLRSLKGPVVAEAILAIGMTWPSGRSETRSIPPLLVEFLSEAADHSSGEASAAAKRILKKAAATSARSA